MMSATDFEALKSELYEGEAVMLNWPVGPMVPQVYVPLEKLPESIQALYKYNPARAKQLLAEAGYPNGFKAKMLVQNTSSELDPAAALKAMWAKVGVEIEIQPRERTVFRGIMQARSHDEMLFADNSGAGFGAYPSMTNIRGPSQNNRVYLNDPVGSDPYSEAIFQEITKNVIINFPKADQLYREKMLPYLLERAFYIQIPTPYNYRIWQPWVKNYNGESNSMAVRYSWVDRDLKEQMTGRR